MRQIPIWLFALLFGLAACSQTTAQLQPINLPLPDLPATLLPVSVETIPLSKAGQACTDTFVTHELDHITTVPGGDEVRMFEANGAGVTIGDLDNDGDLDVVLANHRDPNTVLWNEGKLVFRRERMPYGDSRAVNLVDVDGDGWLDIVLTRRVSGPNYWRNQGQAAMGQTFSERFTPELLPNVAKPAYAMDWGDLDGDGDLDLVTGSYDAGLLVDRGDDFLLGDGAGVYFYEHVGEAFTPVRLARNAQVLTIALIDLNADDQLDILVGNDFAVRDQAWLRQGDGWVETIPFTTTSHSTMSFGTGDINNDGRLELFSTDMKPPDEDPETLIAWQPVIAEMAHPLAADDPQIMENVLQVRNERGEFRNASSDWGVDATGWSWSGKFGDLNNDGFLDLYVVNGMIESTIFSHLPRHELVEENQAFRNDGRGHFIPALEWKLGSTLSGRGMSMADLDHDGDLDIVVNNLRGPAQLFENQLCSGSSLQVDLAWPASRNTRALGAEVVLRTSQGSYFRRVQAASGYLSGDPARIHFGFPGDTILRRVEIHWSDGAISTVDDLTPQTLLAVTR